MAGELKLLQMVGGAASTALLAQALGGTHSVTKGETGTHTLLAAHATKIRAVLVIVTVDEVFADGGTTQTVIEVGQDGTIDLCFDHTKLVNAAAGSVWAFALRNTATNKVIITSTAAGGAGTGGVTVTAIAIPEN